jgi:alanine dehydrogenase
MGGIAGVPPAEVVVIGAGVFGSHAARECSKMGAHVTVLDINLESLQSIYEMVPGVVTLIAYPYNIARMCSYADLVIAAVLVPGERPPIIITREIIRSMKPRSVIMDISIDEGG